MNLHKKGFTLIELIVVMAIVAILVLLAAPRFLGYTKNANVTAMEQDVKVLSDTAELYRIDNGEWPIIDRITSHGVGGVDKLYSIDATKLDGFVKNIKGDIDEYGIAINGTHKGKVFNIKGVRDKNDIPHYGHSNSGNGIYSRFEIEEFMSQGYVPIASAEDLNKVRKNLSGNYIQVANIDLSHIENFKPIGQISSSFEGVYNGGGFTISNLTIESGEGVGLFGNTKNSTIKNIGLTNIDVTGSSYVGGLVGLNNNGSIIEDSFAIGTTKGEYTVGVLVGGNYNGSVITNSYSEGSAKGGRYVGGLAGDNRYNSSIKQSYSTADATGSGRVGGLLGVNTGSLVENTYSTGDATNLDGEPYVGGLIGVNWKMGEVKNSYSVGTVVSNEANSHINGLINDTEDSSSKSSYYDKDTSGMTEGIAAKSTSEMMNKSTYQGWDFDEVWEINNNQYPTLRWQTITRKESD